jgi:hypothetical protein
MKKSVTMAGIAAIGLALGACSSGGQDNAWYEENCAVEISDVRDKFEHGEPTGNIIGTAMTQGPVHAPSGIDENPNLKIGLYTYDELADAMQLEREVNSDDTFCMELEIRDSDRNKTLEPSHSTIEGDLHNPDEYEVDFTLIRSAEYPEGIWIGTGKDGLPQSIEISENMPEECVNQWWSANDLDFNAAAKAEDTTGSTLNRAEDC